MHMMFIQMSGKLSDRLRLESALDLQRRLPPNMIEAHVAKMIDIVSTFLAAFHGLFVGRFLLFNPRPPTYVKIFWKGLISR